MPVVVDMHGFGEPATFHGTNSGMIEASEKEGFVTVLPSGLGIVPVLSINRTGGDTVYIDELLDSLEAGLCLDTSRSTSPGTRVAP